MSRRADMVEEESLNIIYEEVIEVFKKHKCDQSRGTAVALAIINACVKSLYDLDQEQYEEIGNRLAESIEITVREYLEEL